MTSDSPALVCWRCGAAIEESVLPLRREEVCTSCNADLHVCKLCRFFNPRLSDGCDEPIAGGVTNKERANFCDYFTPSASAFAGRRANDAQARAALDALFGGAGGATSSAAAEGDRSELDRLFGLGED